MEPISLPAQLRNATSLLTQAGGRGDHELRGRLTHAALGCQPDASCVDEGAGQVFGQRPRFSLEQRWWAVAWLPGTMGGCDTGFVQPVWRGMKKPCGSVGKERGGHWWHSACGHGLQAWRDSRRPWGDWGMDWGGGRHVPAGTWPAWARKRRPCHRNSSSVGAGPGLLVVQGRRPRRSGRPWNQLAGLLR